MKKRLAPQQALQHPRRAEILRQVTAEPGIYLKELARRLNCRETPVDHHVRVLERSGLLTERRDGPNRRFYLVVTE